MPKTKRGHQHLVLLKKLKYDWLSLLLYYQAKNHVFLRHHASCQFEPLPFRIYHSANRMELIY